MIIPSNNFCINKIQEEEESLIVNNLKIEFTKYENVSLFFGYSDIL